MKDIESLADSVGASGNAADILRLRKEYNDYVLQGGNLSFEQYANQFGKNANPYKNKT